MTTAAVLFTYENGVYTDDPLHGAYLVVNILAGLFGLVFFIPHAKSLSRHDTVAALINVFIPEFSFRKSCSIKLIRKCSAYEEMRVFFGTLFTRKQAGACGIHHSFPPAFILLCAVT